MGTGKGEKEDKIEISKQLQEIRREKKILSGILKYYNQVGRFDHKIGITQLEFKDYLLDNGYEDLRKEFLDGIRKKIEERERELERMHLAKSQKKKQQEELETQEYLKTRMKILEAGGVSQETIEESTEAFGSLKQIMFIPSWSKLIENEFKGFYLNQPVYEIIRDSVILLPDFAVTGIEETRGEAFIFLNGVGLYYTEFRLSPGEIIDDYREITGIVLPMDVFDKAQDLTRTIVNSRDLLMTDYMITIPFSLLQTQQTRQMYIRGVIARNVIHPHSECFNKLVELCKDKNSLNEDEGMKVLCGGLSESVPLYTNEILTEHYLSKYSNLTAGIKNIQPKLDKIVSDLQIQGLKPQIFKNIRAIKKDYITKGWPRLLDWMP
ncbi:MAG: hypothetical protein ACTSPV_10265 [Candidatus Hodarchaeales archaeon]